MTIKTDVKKEHFDIVRAGITQIYADKLVEEKQKS